MGGGLCACGLTRQRAARVSGAAKTARQGGGCSVAQSRGHGWIAACESVCVWTLMRTVPLPSSFGRQLSLMPLRLRTCKHADLSICLFLGFGRERATRAQTRTRKQTSGVVLAAAPAARTVPHATTTRPRWAAARQLLLRTRRGSRCVLAWKAPSLMHSRRSRGSWWQIIHKTAV